MVTGVPTEGLTSTNYRVGPGKAHGDHDPFSRNTELPDQESSSKRFSSFQLLERFQRRENVKGLLIFLQLRKVE